MDDYSKLRKYENTLSISGAAVIAFGLWSIIKAGLYLAAASPKELFGFFKPEDLEKMNTLNVSASGVTGIILFGIFSALFIDLLLRLYVGRAAGHENCSIRRSRKHCMGKGRLCNGCIVHRRFDVAVCVD